MWINRAKYEVEKIQAKQRIEYLENLICPCESHDYRKIDFQDRKSTRLNYSHVRTTRMPSSA